MQCSSKHNLLSSLNHIMPTTVRIKRLSKVLKVFLNRTETPRWEKVLLRYQFSSVAQSCPILCHPMDCSMPGFPVHYQLPELTQTHVHWLGDAIQPSHPLSSPSPPAFNISQHQGIFQWVSSSHQVAKVFWVSASASVFPMNTQDWFPLGWTGLILQSKRFSRVFSNDIVQKHQFFGTQPFLESNSHIHPWLLDKP